jgi:hypothetical protein
MTSSSASTWISMKLIHHHHNTRLVTSSQHEAGTSSQHKAGTSSQHEAGTSSQHEDGTSLKQLRWYIITTINLAHHHNN